MWKVFWLVKLSVASFVLISNASVAATKAVGCESYAYSAVTDERVFNWRFYLNENADLIMGGLQSPADACWHWSTFGASEGRQGHSAFSSKQYLYKYADLKNFYGATNYLGAIGHWISNGVNENRTGYVDNGLNSGFNRSTVANTSGANYKIYVSVSSRTAGAVDSLIVNNKEYINSADHGRQMQIALVATAHGQGWNPTEAGNCPDDRGASSSSVLNSSSVNSGGLTTSNTPAFWEYPGVTSGDCVTGGGAYYTPAVNTTVTANSMRFNKNIQVGVQVGTDYFSNVIKFTTTIPVTAPIPSQNAVIAAPAIYLGGEFTNTVLYNPQSAASIQKIFQGHTPVATYTLNPGGVADVSNLSCYTTLGHCISNAYPFITSMGPIGNASDAIASCSKSYSGPGVNYGNVFSAFKNAGLPQAVDTTTGLVATYNVQTPLSGSFTIPLQTYVVVAQTNAQGTAFSQVANALNKLYSSGMCNVNTAAVF